MGGCSNVMHKKKEKAAGFFFLRACRRHHAQCVHGGHYSCGEPPKEATQDMTLRVRMDSGERGACGAMGQKNNHQEHPNSG